MRVSPLCLGGMSFGDAWSSMLGPCDKPATYAMLDHFKSSGGNFIDTASYYQDEQSETWIGDWMRDRSNRDEMVIATKFTTAYRAHKGYEGMIQSNFAGNNAKGVRLSVEASLAKLGTGYIDLLWLHCWDYTTGIPELMHALNDLVVAGKVIYLGVSDTPAW
jgi:aryl-alcohol dehydrogenase-like predicted oxidoreductase